MVGGSWRCFPETDGAVAKAFAVDSKAVAALPVRGLQYTGPCARKKRSAQGTGRSRPGVDALAAGREPELALGAWP